MIGQLDSLLEQLDALQARAIEQLDGGHGQVRELIDADETDE